MTNRKQSILVLDDEEALRIVLKQDLEARGYCVEHFCYKEDGLTWMETNYPDLIISDINSPRMNGFEFLSIVRSNPATRHSKAIIITGAHDLKNMRRATELGALAFLSKPWNEVDLPDLVARLLEEEYTYTGI